MRLFFKTPLSLFTALLFSLFCQTSSGIYGQGYGPTDFIVADSGKGIAIYDQNLVFQRYIETSTFMDGLDFLPNGNLVSVGYSGQVNLVSQYNRAGTRLSTFVNNSKIGFAVDIKVGPSNLLYIPTWLRASVSEFTLSGVFNRQIGTSQNYRSIAVLPGGVLWVGWNGATIDVFDIPTGSLVNTIALDNGQTIASAMYYSPATNTVLTTDLNTGLVFERTTTGAFVRQFTPPGGTDPATVGVTRGPGGDVFAAYSTAKLVVHWKPDGTFVNSTSIAAKDPFAANIVWVGNTRPTVSDFGADHKTDVSVWNPSSHDWSIIDSQTGSTRTVVNWGDGSQGDRVVPGDYDGDKKTDAAFWHPADGGWHIINSSDNSVRVQYWGLSTDIPVPADYDNDGKVDLAVYRPSEGNWYIIRSSGGGVVINWGLSTDKPAPADYDGDGKADVAVWRESEGNWYIIQSSSGGVSRNWGQSGDKLVPADYDGDGKTDLAVFRPSEGNWYIIQSSSGGTVRGWGVNGDIPVPADYDGDGKADIAVFRPSEGRWYIIQSSTNTGSTAFLGNNSSDVPIPNAYLPQ